MQKVALIRSLDKSIQRIDSMFFPAKADFLKLRLNESKDVDEQKVILEHILPSMHTAWCAAVVKNEYKRTTTRLMRSIKYLPGQWGAQSILASESR